MERFYLITNRAKDPDLTVTDQIRQYLEERGKTCLLCDNSEKGEKYHYTDPAKVPSDIDGILVLGGDGTLLQAAGDGFTDSTARHQSGNARLSCGNRP